MGARNSAAAESIDRELVITRIFNAPRDLVWKAFTDRDRMAKWWGMKGLTTRVLELDLRPGGTFLYVMRMPDGREMCGKWVYREIVAPELLVVVHFTTDETGKPIPHPYDPNLPPEMLTTSEISRTCRADDTRTALGPDKRNACSARGLQQAGRRDGRRLQQFAGPARRIPGGALTARYHQVSLRELMQLNPYLTFNGNCAAAMTSAMPTTSGSAPADDSDQNENLYVDIAKSERLVYKHVSASQFQQESPR